MVTARSPHGTPPGGALAVARSLVLPVVVALTVSLTAAGCTAGKGVDVNGGSSGGGGGGRQLVAALSAEPDQLDPQKTTAYASFQVLANVYDTLVAPDDELVMRPALATRWTTSKDQLTWTFTLRRGVKFHDGHPFTAADVVYSVDRIIKGKLPSSYRLASVKKIAAVDDHTVTMKLSRPTPNLLVAIGGYTGLGIVEKQNVSDKQIGKHPVGTGAFEFSTYTPGDSIVLKRNPGYWGGAPKLGSVKFIFVKEPTVALADLRSGQAQWTDNLPPQQVQGLKKDSSVKLGITPSNDYWYFATNERRKPFDDPRVRQALAWGIDRNAVTKAAKFGLAATNQTAIPKTSKWYDPYAPYSYDPAKARALLKAAGVKKLTIDFMVTNEYPETVTAAQVMASELAKVGVTLKIRTEDFATWLADEGKGKYDAFMLGWLGNLDPDEFYYAQHHTDGTNNFQKFSDQQVDRLLDRARSESDEAARKQLYAQAVKRIVDQASYVYLYNPDVVQGWSPKLTGYTARADRAIRFADASLAG